MSLVPVWSPIRKMKWNLKCVELRPVSQLIAHLPSNGILLSHKGFSMLTIEELKVARPSVAHTIPIGAAKECGREVIERALREKPEYGRAWKVLGLLHRSFVPWNRSAKEFEPAPHVNISAVPAK